MKLSLKTPPLQRYCTAGEVPTKEAEGVSVDLRFTTYHLPAITEGVAEK